jgi:hypothetical protein
VGSFVRGRLAPIIGVATLILGARAAAAGPPPYRRHVPSAFIKAVEGCWQVTPDERITIRRRGSDGLETKSRFDPESVGPFNRAGHRWEEASYWPEPGGLEIACGQTSHHGQVCLVRPADDKLEVQLWSLRHTSAAKKSFMRTTLANRCAAEPRQPRLRAETRK